MKKTLKEEIEGNPEPEWIRIHNFRFEKKGISSYRMYSVGDEGKRKLIIIHNDKPQELCFKPEDRAHARLVMAKLDMMFCHVDLNREEDTYF